jgi:hypothetical protein
MRTTVIFFLTKKTPPQGKGFPKGRQSITPDQNHAFSGDITV